MLNVLEMGEINGLCLKTCIDHEGFVRECFKNCETTLTRLMLQNQFDLVPVTEFSLEKRNESRSGIVLSTAGLGILIILIALFIVGRKVYKSLHKKHLDHYHKMKSRK
jgi:hypothetical protein